MEKQGHERCWYYPELFTELVNLFELVETQPRALPSREEFEKGCRRYQNEQFGEKGP
jgi:hypothetical protein